MAGKQKIAATRARYIKLGRGGEWWSLCKADSTLRLGYYEAPHEAALAGDREAIRAIWLKDSKAGAASDHARQVLDFYDTDPGTIWITLADDYLWWCQAEPTVEFIGYDRTAHLHGSRLRRAKGGWSNRSIQGNLLRIRELNGELTKVGAYRSTICDVDGKAFDYLLRKINDDPIPAIIAAQEARADLLRAVVGLLELLHWKDFELLVDLIFSQSGWRRMSVVGDGLKTTDINLELPSTGERAMVQVKSRTNQKQLDEYIAAFTQWEIDRLFYVYHSLGSAIALDSDNPRVTLIGPEKLAGMVLRAGLTDWLMQKVG